MAKKTTQFKPKQNEGGSKAKISFKLPKDLPFWTISIIFVVTTGLFFWEQLLQHSFFWEDFVEFVFPVQNFAAREFAKWSLPFWNPFTFNGMPFLADLQVGFFYPINRLLSLVFISSNNLPVIAIEIIIIVHFLISQINMYFLARYFKISSYGAIIAAISYSFSMLMVCHVIHPMIVYHLSWFPLILMLFIKGLQSNKLYYSIYAGLIYGTSMLAGHPQTTLYEALFLFIVFIWYLIAGLRKKEIDGKKILIYLAAGAIPLIVSAGIFSVQYLPSKELAALSQRNEITYEKATEGSLQFKQVYCAVVPKMFGSVDGANEKNPSYYLDDKGSVQRHIFWETSYYFGIIALILGIFGAAVNFRKREIALLIFIAIFGFLYALGDNSFIFNMFYGLPLFGSFRNPARMMFLTILAFSLLAGFGFDSLWKEKHKNSFIFLVVAGAVPLLIALLASSGSLFSALNTPENLRGGIQEIATTSIIFIAIALAVSILINKTILNPIAGGIILAVLTMFDLYLAGASFNQNPQNPVKTYELKPDVKTMLTPQPPKEIFRANMRLYKPISFMAMQRNQGLLDNIMLVEGYNPLVLDRVRPPVEGAKQIHDLYNVRYEVKVDLEKGSWAFIERDSYYPRAWLATNAIIVKPEEVSNKMKYGTYDYRNDVILEEEPGLKLNTAARDSLNDEVTCIEYNNNNFKYKVKSTENSVLVFSEIWYPAWKAYVDGKPAKVLRADYCFRAVPVAQGEHTVEMKYESDAFLSGVYISFGTLLISILGLLFSHRFQQD